MFLKTVSKHSKGSMQDVNNIQQTWQQQQFRSDGGKSVGKNNTWRPIIKGKSERNVGFTDRVNLQDFGHKLSDHKRNITEREFIFSDSDESDGEQFMSTPRKSRPAKAFQTPLPFDIVELAKTDGAHSDKLRLHEIQDENEKQPETPVMFPNMMKEMPMPNQLLLFEETSNTISSIQPSPDPSPKNRNSNNIQLITRETFYTLCQ